jgi:Trk-type K+ transport system membrane component
MSTTVIMVIGGVGFFVAMGLMRWTWRQSRRRPYGGIQWRGID